MDKRDNCFVPLNFPATRNALWDYRAVGPPIHLHAIQNKNVLISVSETPLRLLHRLAEESSSETFSCTLLGSVEFPEDGDSIFVHIERLDQSCRPVENYSLGPTDVFVACKMTKNCARPESSVEEYSTAVKMLAHCSFHDNQSSIILHLDCDLVTPTSEFKMTPVNPIPIVPTALSKNLSGPNGAACFPGQAKFGFLTMDQTRKLLLILASDPKVSALPLVGVWVSGVTGLTEPILWCACMQYIHSKDLKHRVCMPPEHFLLLIYSTRHSKPLFYQCCTSDGSSRLNFDLSSSHEVLQLPKNGMCRSQSPLEMDMALVELGPKRTTFEAALQSIQDSVEDSAPSVSRRKSDSVLTAGHHDDITPRSKPMPHHRQAPSVRYSVPDVSLVEESSPQPKRQSLPTDYQPFQSSALPHRSDRASWPNQPLSMPMQHPAQPQDSALSQPNMEYTVRPNPARIPHFNSHPQMMQNPSQLPQMRINPYQHPHHPAMQDAGYSSHPMIQHSGTPMQQQTYIPNAYSGHQARYPRPQHNYQTSYPSAPSQPQHGRSQMAPHHPCSTIPAQYLNPLTPMCQSTPLILHLAVLPIDLLPSLLAICRLLPQASLAQHPDLSCLRNSTDSGLQVSNSDQFDDFIEGGTPPTKAPPDVYELLSHQEKQLKELRLQIAQLLANQSQSPERKEAGIQSSDTTSQNKETCSVASNTSLWLGNNTNRGHTDRAVSPMREGDSLNDTVISNGDQLSNETLNFDDFQLAQIQERTDSFVSEMIVDMPAYSSTSPVKNDGSFASCSQYSGLSPQSVSMHVDHPEEETDGAQQESSPVHLKQFYNALLGNVQKFLQPSDNEVYDLDCSAYSEPVKPVTDNSSIKAHLKQRQNTSLHNVDKSIDVAQMTKKQLENLGINLDSLLESRESTDDCSIRPDQSTFLLDAAMLPKVNYRSLWLDSGDSDMSADADALAMKYLTDEQLSELARVRSKRSTTTGGNKNPLNGLSRVLSTRPSGRDASMMPHNQMSLCSRKYLERYGLLDDDDNAVLNAPAVHGGSHNNTAASLDVSGDAVINVQEFLKKMAEKRNLANVVAGRRNGSVESSGVSDDSRSLSSGHGCPRDEVDSIRSFRANDKPTSTPADACAKHYPRDRTPKEAIRSDLRSTPAASPGIPHEAVSNRVLDIDRLRELPKLL
ncbi:hypothetical protein CAPTEDRAFT_219123 [Capitella teleta]|uniref:SCL-interrupting locus protein homolog n=1 Tax=Capitella teleta TaxID=283909 RepID=R7UK18_CAPTE|nr:hypothetical protein CAPTEDRAFT_219123 [Capitella teleta]|eukprot:ELU03617.1 hypothetical protein CAPTEDRAFT_219123 [Capitella teleta]